MSFCADKISHPAFQNESNPLGAGVGAPICSTYVGMIGKCSPKSHLQIRGEDVLGFAVYLVLS